MQTRMAPKIEIVGRRDAVTQEFDLVVLVDGKRRDDVRWEIVDAAAITGRVPLTTWRATAWMAALETSPGYARRVTELYVGEEKHVDLYDDRRTAENAQPGATTVEELEPAVWFRAAASSANPNNLNAARAVVAVKVFRTCPALSQREALKTMLSAYRAAIGGSAEGLATTLQDLLADLRHLADAWQIQIEAKQDPENLIGCAIAGVANALDEAATSTWADELAAAPGLPWTRQLAKYALSDLKITAYNRYLDRVIQQH